MKTEYRDIKVGLPNLCTIDLGDELTTEIYIEKLNNRGFVGQIEKQKDDKNEITIRISDFIGDIYPSEVIKEIQQSINKLIYKL